jgi:hypothetical protein
MPDKDPRRRRARRIVADRFRQFVDRQMSQFTTRPEELLQRVEAKISNSTLDQEAR